MARFNGVRNFGYGKQMAYAGHRALREAYQGHYATVAAHSERWGQFARWCKGQGLRDARHLTLEVIEAYGRTLAGQVQEGQLKVAYAQNLLSSVNVTLGILRGDERIRLCPSAWVGQRSTVRTTAPASLDRERMARAVEDLWAAGHHRAASILELARDLGLREREAALLDAREALRQAQGQGRINVTEGTKGGRGREVDRWVPVSARGLQTLIQAAKVQDQGRNLIPVNRSWVQFNHHLHAVTAPVLARYSLTGIHDGRAAYACERYQALTGHPAPVVAGHRAASKAADRQARRILAQELGHHRIEVLTEYVGSSR